MHSKKNLFFIFLKIKINYALRVVAWKGESRLRFVSTRNKQHQKILNILRMASNGGSASATAATPKFRTVDFEVFGIVQGVFFRKYTQQEANKLKLVGWVMNTHKGTVTGRMQGKEDTIKKMKEWLKYVGSPKSTIERVEFKSERDLSKLEFHSFEIKK